MKASAQTVVENLSSIDAEARLAALRSLKNVVIGDKRKKSAFVQLGAVQLLVEILASDSDPALLIQAAAAVGSFAASEEGVRAVVQHAAIPQLLRALQRSEPKVVEAAVRSLKMVYKSPLAPKAAVFVGDTPARLVSLLPSPMSNVPEAAAGVIASCCETPEQQDALVAAGAVPPLVALLAHPQHSKQGAALESLAALTRGPRGAAAAVCLAHEGLVDQALSFLKHPSPHVRYLACVCLTNLCQHLPAQPAGSRSQQEVQQAVLPVLVRLLGECGGEGEDVPSVLCQLVEGSAELQRAATDADAIAKLAVFVRDAGCPPRRKEGALRVLGLLCSSAEANRRQLVECRVLPQLAGALGETWPPLRAAACLCMRSLSRSTNLLRSNLGDVDLAGPLLRLTEEEDATVAWQAAAALANLTVDCSTVKEAVLSLGGVQRFVSLSQSMHHLLRLYGIWGLSSIAFRSTPDVRDTIMQQLAWGSLAALLEDPEPDIREKAVLLLRNLAYNSSSQHSQQQGGVGGGAGAAGGGTGRGCSLQSWSGGEVLPAVKRALERPNPSSALKEHALYVVVNMASGSEEQKEAVMAHGWPAALLAHMGDTDPRVREAAVWAVINLSWSKDGDGGAPQRIAAMRELGLEAKLRDLQHDESLPVKERALTGLQQFGGWAEEGRGARDEEMRQVQEDAAAAAASAAAAAAAASASRLRMHFRD